MIEETLCLMSRLKEYQWDRDWETGTLGSAGSNWFLSLTKFCKSLLICCFFFNVPTVTLILGLNRLATSIKSSFDLNTSSGLLSK